MWEEDFFDSNAEPVNQSPFGPLFSDVFNAVLHLAEGSFGCIGCYWNPLFVLNPPIKEGTEVLGKILYIVPGLAISS